MILNNTPNYSVVQPHKASGVPLHRNNEAEVEDEELVGLLPFLRLVLIGLSHYWPLILIVQAIQPLNVGGVQRKFAPYDNLGRSRINRICPLSSSQTCWCDPATSC